VNGLWIREPKYLIGVVGFGFSATRSVMTGDWGKALVSFILAGFSLYKALMGSPMGKIFGIDDERHDTQEPRK